MPSELARARAIADDHLSSETQAGGDWRCPCDACRGVRSLIGLDKVLKVRPLVRAIERLGGELERTPDGPDRRRLAGEYYDTCDRLAETVAAE